MISIDNSSDSQAWNKKSDILSMMYVLGFCGTGTRGGLQEYGVSCKLMWTGLQLEQDT